MNLPRLFKIFVSSAEESKKIQTKLFQLGFTSEDYFRVDSEKEHYILGNGKKFSLRTALYQLYNNFVPLSSSDFEDEEEHYYTDFSPGLWAFCEEIGKSKEVKICGSQKESTLIFLTFNKDLSEWSLSGLNINEKIHHGLSFLPSLKFLEKIEELPDKEEVMEILSFPFTVKVVRNNSRTEMVIDSTSFPLPQVTDLIATIKRDRSFHFQSFSAIPGRNGITINNKKISWENWDAFVTKFNEYNENSF